MCQKIPGRTPKTPRSQCMPTVCIIYIPTLNQLIGPQLRAWMSKGLGPTNGQPFVVRRRIGFEKLARGDDSSTCLRSCHRVNHVCAATAIRQETLKLVQLKDKHVHSALDIVLADFFASNVLMILRRQVKQHLPPPEHSPAAAHSKLSLHHYPDGHEFGEPPQK